MCRVATGAGAVWRPMAGDRELAILNPERNLWQEVMLHTIRDARLKVPRRKLGENVSTQ